MAVIRLGTTQGLNPSITAILESLTADLENAEELSTSSSLTFTGEGFRIVISGRGFGVEDGEYMEGGAATGITYVKNGVTLLSVTGMSVPPDALYEALNSNDVWNAWFLMTGGNDTITGTGADDYLFGSTGHNTLIGGQGHDDLAGGEGNDTLIGGAGEDWMTGWSGNDVFNGTAAANDPSDYDMVSYLDEGKEKQTGVYVNMSTRSVIVDGITIAAGRAIDAFKNTDTLIDIEDVRATHFNDYVNAGSTASEQRAVVGFRGDDRLVGGTGVDTARYDLDDNKSDNGEYLHLTQQGASAASNGHGVIANLTTGKITVEGRELAAGAIKDTFGDIDTTSGFENVYGTIFRDHMEDGNEANYFVGDLGDDTLNGGGGDDELKGGAGNDSLNGGNGDDWIVGGDGNDTIDGGDGYDHLNYADLTGPVKINLSANAAGEIASGTAVKPAGDSSATDSVSSIERVTGTIQADTIIAATLTNGDYFNMNGLRGADTLAGSETGMDRIRYDRDATSNLGGAGIIANLTGATITSGGATLQAGQVRDGFGDIDTVSWIDAITATNSADRLHGGSLNESFNGLGGADFVDGGDGNDTASYYRDRDYAGGGRGVIVNLSAANMTIGRVAVASGTAIDGFGSIDTLRNIETVFGTAFADTLITGAGGNTLNSMEGNDTLTGGAGRDKLDGGAGNDTMSGGAGNDVYIVDSAGDRVNDTGGERDLVESSISFSLAALASIEDLTLTGAAAINGTGNDLDNVLTGNSGRNILTGGKGNDVYVVGAGDTIVENADEGTDTIATSVTFSLSENVENLTLTGGAAINGIGNDLNNILTGNAARNVLTGGRGDDIYNVTAGDLVVEAAGGGTDTVRSGVNWVLAAHVENLELTGAANINGTGNAENNDLSGNAGNNVLDGGLG